MMEFDLVLNRIQTPTLMVDEKCARQNIQRMVQKAMAHHVQFRPHFKTHQSAQIGGWFREAGVKRITVSSLEMAAYFKEHGWEDVLVAFPFNLREIETINHLAGTIHLGLLVDQEVTAAFLVENCKETVHVWIKIDTGLGRAGIPWNDNAALKRILQQLSRSPNITICGLLTHAGQTYRACNIAEIQQIARQSLERIIALKQEVSDYYDLDISIGDTPGCLMLNDFDGVDEIRPGNFVFFDANMLQLGVCKPDEIAVRLICPITGKYDLEKKLVLYGGAVHLSKDTLEISGKRMYGWISLPTENNWGLPLLDCPLISLSQEHGIASITPEVLHNIQTGDLVGIVPVHSCLTVACMGEYITSDGQRIMTMRDWFTERRGRSELAQR